MKKLLCIVLALVSVVSLAACSGNPTNNNETTDPSKETVTEVYTWPDNVLFKDIPSLSDNITYYNHGENENGHTFTFFADGFDYKEFCAYIKKLEDAEFNYYDLSNLDIYDTEDVLPEELEDGTFNASWIGKRRGLYVSAQWYGDEYYEENNLPKDNNVRLTFYSYDVFKLN